MDCNFISASRKGHSWVLEEKWQYCSWLELEIQAAALCDNGAANHCMFYIRDFKRGYFKQDLTQHESLDDFDTHGGYSMFEAESIYAEKKLYELKMSIVKKGWPIKYFSSSID